LVKSVKLRLFARIWAVFSIDIHAANVMVNAIARKRLFGLLESKMSEDTASVQNEEFSFQSVGERLKAERELRGLSLEDIATKTRVPLRHLVSIEGSEYGKIPGHTYTLGFVRSYARALKMDEVKLSSDLRSELAASGHSGYNAPTQNYEPTDPSSVPSRLLAWTAAAIAVVMLAGFFIWRGSFMDAGEAPVVSEPVQQAATPVQTGTAAVTAATPVDANGDVVLTATGVVWAKVYDANKKRLFEAEMKAGESYTVPKDANGPMILTGRPDMIKVTVGGKEVAPLSNGNTTISNVPISAKALAERAPAAAGTPAAGAAPSADISPAVNTGPTAINAQ
jgi:cytoskeleton protein RodZ